MKLAFQVDRRGSWEVHQKTWENGWGGWGWRQNEDARKRG